jgi:hypothetical protein
MTEMAHRHLPAQGLCGIRSSGALAACMTKALTPQNHVLACGDFVLRFLSCLSRFGQARDF